MPENTSDNQKNDVNDSNQSSNSIYEGKDDHEVILILEKQVSSLHNNLAKSEQQNATLMKMQGQISVVRLVFIGVMTLIGCMVVMSVVSWWSPKVTGGIEKELAFFERLLLVMLGILSSAVVALYDSRGAGSSSGGG